MENKRKEWRPKPRRVELVPEQTAATPKETTVETEEQTWTTINNETRERGNNKITYIEIPNTIPCANGFGVLDILNDPLAAIGSIS